MADAVLHPEPGKNPPDPGHCCVMIANQPDIDTLHRLTRPASSRRVLMSRLTWGHHHIGAAVMGPFIGSPYAAMLLESLIAWGVRETVFFGWCGAVAPHVRIGDIVIPDAAFIDDGTSASYLSSPSETVAPSQTIQRRLKSVCARRHLPFLEGPVWSTDAIFRETPEKILRYQAKNVLAVEMEAAALFSVGAFRHADVGCVLVVSDELSSLSWKPGFRDPDFAQKRRQVCDLLCDLWPPTT